MSSHFLSLSSPFSPVHHHVPPSGNSAPSAAFFLPGHGGSLSPPSLSSQDDPEGAVPVGYVSHEDCTCSRVQKSPSVSSLLSLCPEWDKPKHAQNCPWGWEQPGITGLDSAAWDCMSPSSLDFLTWGLGCTVGERKTPNWGGEGRHSSLGFPGFLGSIPISVLPLQVRGIGRGPAEPPPAP